MRSLPVAWNWIAPGTRWIKIKLRWMQGDDEYGNNY